MGFFTRAMVDDLQLLAPPPVVEQVPTPELGAETWMYVRALTVPEAEMYEQRHGYPIRRLYNALYTMGEVSEADVKELKLEALDLFEAQTILEQSKSTRIPLVILAACDPEGQPLFTAQDQSWLERQQPKLIKRLYDAAWKLNGFGVEAAAVAEKNSGSTQSNDSGSALPSNGVVLSAS